MTPSQESSKIALGVSDMSKLQLNWKMCKRAKKGACFHENTSQKTFWEVEVAFQRLSWSIFCLRKLVSFVSLFLINWHRERTASVSREFVYEIMITDKWNVNPHFSVQITLPLNFKLERDILILPKCNDNEFEQKNSLSQSFSCLNHRAPRITTAY